jgi:hypothetical protein
VGSLQCCRACEARVVSADQQAPCKTGGAQCPGGSMCDVRPWGFSSCGTCRTAESLTLSVLPVLRRGDTSRTAEPNKKHNFPAVGNAPRCSPEIGDSRFALCGLRVRRVQRARQFPDTKRAFLGHCFSVTDMDQTAAGITLFWPSTPAEVKSNSACERRAYRRSGLCARTGI